MVRFEQEEGAILTQPPKDVNARECAMVRVMTTTNEISFDESFCSAQKLKTSEIDIYLPPNSRWLTIRRKGYKVLDYHFPTALESKMVYVMELEYNKLDKPENAMPQENWLLLKALPKDAMVKIDGETVPLRDGGATKMLNVGKHKYEANCDMYHATTGDFEVTADKTTTLDITLKPNFGYVKITSEPESDADVFIDDKRNGVTPFTSDKLPSGTHIVEVVKDMYKSTRKEVTVRDGETETVTITMEPNFAEPVFTCSDAEAEIWINGEKKGTGKWTGRLPAGPYKVKTTKPSHKEIEKSMTLKAGDNSTITLDPPTPIYGRISVNSTPFEADIYLDGKKMGLTPKLLNNILIGSHELRIEKKGCAAVTRTVKVDEGKTAEISVDLPTGETITLKSNPTGATIYIDGENSGTAPVTQTLSYGSHNIKAEKDGVTKEMTVTVKEKGETEWTLNVRKGPQTETITVNGVSFKMVYVEGGTFTMGCTSEQGSDCYDDEKPSHEVTVSDFSIGETEVTQALWKAVMGSNPSAFKGDNLPVEQVSWNDCHEFMKKLNKLTGKKFRLPTEAEWEYAARKGNKSRGYKYSGSNTIGYVAWYINNSSAETHAVKGKRANELGLYDMSGNVYEWCGDWYGNYSGSSQTDPTGPSSGSYRVIRSGSWDNYAWGCRVSSRYNYFPDYHLSRIGFRLVMVQ